MNSELQRYIDRITDRVRAEPDLDDFLSWTAGTLEYWLHIIASSVGRRIGWASTTEVPYVTTYPKPRSKSDRKWADGAAILRGNEGVLLEVKTVPARKRIPGLTIRKVPADFAALVSTDWKRTLQLDPDQYSGAPWVDRRKQMETVHGLELLLIHGEVDLKSIDAEVDAGIKKGVRALEYGFRHIGQPPWLSQVRQTMLEQPPERRIVKGHKSEAVLYAWATELQL